MEEDPLSSDNEDLEDDDTDEYKILSCKLCDYKRAGQRRLWDHIIRAHPNTRPHQCPQCIYRAKGIGTLNRHIRRMHKKAAMDMGLTFVCLEPNCHLKFSLKRELDDHAEWHYEQNVKNNNNNKSLLPYVKESLTPSTNSHGSDTNDLSTDSLSDRHIQGSTLPPLTCRRCGYSYKTFKDIRAHIKTHKRLRGSKSPTKKCLEKYHCRLGTNCPYKTNSPDDLITHKMAKHKNEMTHMNACKACRTRGWVTSLCTLKPFLCVFCRVSFTFLDSLRTHYRNIHNCVDDSDEEVEEEDEEDEEEDDGSVDSMDGETTYDEEDADDEKSKSPAIDVPQEEGQKGQRTGSEEDGGETEVEKEREEKGNDGSSGMGIIQENVESSREMGVQNLSEICLQGQNLRRIDLEVHNFSENSLDMQNMSVNSLDTQNMSETSLDMQNMSQMSIEVQNMNEIGFDVQNMSEPSFTDVQNEPEIDWDVLSDMEMSQSDQDGAKIVDNVLIEEIMSEKSVQNCDKIVQIFQNDVGMIEQVQNESQIMEKVGENDPKVVIELDDSAKTEDKLVPIGERKVEGVRKKTREMICLENDRKCSHNVQSGECLKGIRRADVVYRCKVSGCNYASLDAKKLTVHQLKEHQLKRIPKEMKTFICKVCGIRFIFGDNLMIHMIDSHSVEQLEAAQKQERRRSKIKR